MRKLRFPPAAGLAALLAACAAPQSWQKPGADRDQTAFDLQGCRSQARARMDSHPYRAIEQGGSRTVTAERIDQPTVFQRLDEYAARKDFKTLIGDCMARKGYRLAGPGRDA